MTRRERTQSEAILRCALKRHLRRRGEAFSNDDSTEELLQRLPDGETAGMRIEANEHTYRSIIKAVANDAETHGLKMVAEVKISSADGVECRAIDFIFWRYS